MSLEADKNIQTITSSECIYESSNWTNENCRKNFWKYMVWKANLVTVTAFLLPTVNSSWVQSGVASAVPIWSRSVKIIKSWLQKIRMHIWRRVNDVQTYFRQIILSWLYFLAKAIREGSMIPPRRRSTKCRVDSEDRQYSLVDKPMSQRYNSRTSKLTLVYGLRPR